MSDGNFRYFEDFVVGEMIDLGEFPTLEEADMIAFAKKFEPEPFHVDPAAAEVSIYGGLTAAGGHLAVICMRLMVDTVLNRSDAQGSPGVDEIRFVRPARPGDILSGRFTVLAADPSKTRPRIGKLKIRVELRNQHGEQVLVMTASQFYGRRPDSGAGPSKHGNGDHGLQGVAPDH
jgi:acyl dehydratase